MSSTDKQTWELALAQARTQRANVEMRVRMHRGVGQEQEARAWESQHLAPLNEHITRLEGYLAPYTKDGSNE